MKKTIILMFGALLLCNGITMGQTPTVNATWETSFNPNLNVKKGHFYMGYLGEDDDNYFILQQKIKFFQFHKFFVEKYNKKTMTPAASTGEEALGEKLYVMDIYEIGKETYASVNKVKALMYGDSDLRQFNKNTMKFEALLPEIDMTDIEELKTSQDSSKVLFVSEDPDKKDTYKFTVRDTELNLLFEKSITIEEYESAAVANDGTAYVVVKEKKKGKKDEEFEIVKLSSSDVKRFSVTMNNYLYQQIGLIPTVDSNILVIGFYSDPAVKDKGGYCFFGMNADFSGVENAVYNEIPADILNAYRKKRMKDRFNDYEFREILYGEGGEIVTFAEEHDEETHREVSLARKVNDNGIGTKTDESARESTSYTHSYFDIYVFRINDNKLSWTKRVPKYQRALDRDGYKKSLKISFVPFLLGSNIVLVYNENTKANMNLTENTTKIKIAAEGRDFGLVSVTLDSAGEQKKSLVNSTGTLEKRMFPEVQRYSRISNTEVLVPASSISKFKVGVISVK
jgi:hypothetical protein